MSNKGEERLLELLRQTMASREPLVEDSASRVREHVRGVGGQRTPRTTWIVSGTAIAAAIASVFVWTSLAADRKDDDRPGPGYANPIGCDIPEAHLGSQSAQRTWTASTGHPAAIGGGLRFEAVADPAEQRTFRFSTVTVIVGRPGTPGSPTALKAGIGVLASKAAVVRNGKAPTKARVVFEAQKPGRYPVWVLVGGTCGQGTSTSADPVGFVQVEHSVTKACTSVTYQGHRYFLSTAGPELGPGRPLGTAKGSDCERGASQTVRIFTISESTPSAGLNVVYPGLGVRHYYR